MDHYYWKYWIIPVAVPVAVLVILFYLTSGIPENQFFEISGIKFENADTLTIGEKGDIHHPSLPENLVKVYKNPNKNSIKVIIDQPCYIKINNKTANCIPITEASKIKIDNVEITGRELLDGIRGYKNMYYKFGYIYDLLGKRNTNALKKSQSLVYRENDEYSIILLDSVTSINNKGFQYIFTYEETDEVKIQFFDVKESDQILSDPDFFELNNKKHFLSPDVIRSDFGAGHYLIRYQDNSSSVYWGNPLKIRIEKERLRELYDKNSRLGIDVKQSFLINPQQAEIYLPAFSKAIPDYLFSLKFKGDTLTLVHAATEISLEKSKEINLDNLSSAKGNASLLISHDKISSATIQLPMAFYIVFAIVFYFIQVYPTYTNSLKRDPVEYVNIDNTHFYSPNHYNAWKPYYLSLLLVLLCFIFIKLYISVKLAYTYPYFTKIHPLVFLSAPAIILMVIAGWMLIELLNPISKFHGIPKKPGRSQKKRLTMQIVLSIVVFIITIAGEVFYFNFYKAGILHVNNSLLRYEQFSLLGLNRLLDSSGTAWEDNYFPVYLIIFYILIISVVTINLILFYRVFQLQKEVIGNGKWLYSFVDKQLEKLTKWIRELRIYRSEKKWLSPVIFVIAIIAVFIISLLIPTTGLSVLLILFCLFSFFILRKYTGGKFIGFIAVIPAVIGAVAIARNDSGFLLYIIGLVLLFYSLIILWPTTAEEPPKIRKILLWIFSILIIVIPLFLWLNTNENDILQHERIKRVDRRMTAFYNFELLREVGHKSTEKEAESFVLMGTYSGRGFESPRPIFDSTAVLNDAISRGSTPVVLNDYAFLTGFISTTGFFSLLSIILLWVTLLYVVLGNTIGQSYNRNGNKLVSPGWFSFPSLYHSKSYGENINEGNLFHSAWLLRLFAVIIFVIPSIWLLLSYYSIVPFTGRLITGTGQDSLWEILELILLFILMGFRGNKYLTEGRNQHNGK